MADVFLSYSRRDQAFVRRLHAALEAAGKDSWVDWEGIPPTAKWMDEVRAAIDQADAFVFVVSPDSAGSPGLPGGGRACPGRWASASCRWSGARPSSHPCPKPSAPTTGCSCARATISRPAWPPCSRHWTPISSGSRHIPAWSPGHVSGRPTARSAATCSEAAIWMPPSGPLPPGERRNPAPTPLQTEYVFASRRAETRGQRTRTAFLSGGLVLALVLAGFALAPAQRGHQPARPG